MTQAHDNPTTAPVTRRRFIAGATLATIAGAGWAATRTPELPDFVPSGDPAPSPPDGALVTASLEEFEAILVGQAGRPVVVNVWASWCAPCRTEMPLLQAAADAYAGDALLLGVASNDGRTEARAFLDELDLSYPNIFDSTGEIRVALGLTAYPTTYVFGRDGAMRARVNGGISEQRLAALIDDALR